MPDAPLPRPPEGQPAKPLTSEATFRLMVQHVVDYAIFMLDPTGRVVTWNVGAERIKGYRAAEIIGRHFSTFYPPEDVAAGKPDRELEVVAAYGRLEDEGWRVRRDGSRFWANVVITALYDETGTLRGFGKVTRDLTERRNREQALTDHRRLLAHLVEAQERERQRIAWDVHDDSIQAMIAVGMRLKMLADRLPAEHAGLLAQLDDAVAASVTRLRTLAFELRPPAIDREGLVEALSGYLDQVVGGWGLKHVLRHDLAEEPPLEVAVTTFRICQEALNNVRRHARAGTVEVSLRTQDGGVLVRVTDDGIGPPDDAIGLHPGPDHFGIIEMRERAEIAGGWWTLRAGPTGGTLVEFWLPATRSRPVGSDEE
ncbi:MAG: PAS domain S-box protein [Mycobacteriales bacterium]